MARSDERRSVCASPRKGAPARIHFCFIDAESVDVQAEIASVAQQVVAPLGLSGLARMQREADVVGAILGRMRAMARGQLPEGNPPALSPVVSQPDLFELRWKFAKETDAPVARQRELQNAVMEEGQRRFTVGEQCHWGHTRACPHCLDL